MVLAGRSQDNLKYRKIFLLWVPLAAMWLMMGIEMPLINGVIARLADAKANLAAFGITLAIALIVEAPVIQLLAAGTALADSKKNYNRLLHFTHILAAGLTLFHLVLGLSPLYSLLLRSVLKVPEQIIEISRLSFLWMFPWSAAVAYRRFWQGVLIRYEKTTVVPVIMVVRILFSGVVLAAGFSVLNISGAEVGGLALSLGVTAGAVSSFLFARPLVRNLEDDDSVPVLSWKELGIFYYPLALTSYMTFMVRPVLTYGIARALYPLESLAVWPVVSNVLFLFRSTAMAYQEVTVSLLKDDMGHYHLSRFALILGGILSAVLLILAATPLGTLVYRSGSGLENDLLPFTVIPTWIVVAVPFITAMISWYRGLLIHKHQTRIIAGAVFINSVSLIVIALGGPLFFELPGGIFAALAYTGSLAVELVFLQRKAHSGSEILAS
ncbi:MAG: hypothetical protein PQJ58_20565 [Spirochaetales bacterium]|nr:hypothetical protein [Spirochaetales bacterium]